MTEEGQGHTYCKLKTCAFGLTSGILWSVSVFVMAIVAGYFETWVSGVVNLMSSMYIGYDTSLAGALSGLGWCFVDGFIGGFVFAWLYNFCCCCCCKRH